MDIRRAFGVSVLVVKRAEGAGERIEASPDADFRLQTGDVMLVLGRERDLPAVRRGVPEGT